MDSWYVDNMGNLITFKKGTGLNRKVMLAAHMDEVVFSSRESMITAFKVQGSRWYRYPCPGREKGQNRQDGVPGVIGYKPIHLQDSTERQSTVKKAD